jgi:hypothetical protein
VARPISFPHSLENAPLEALSAWERDKETRGARQLDYWRATGLRANRLVRCDTRENPGCAPQRVGGNHPFDETSNPYGPRHGLFQVKT